MLRFQRACRDEQSVPDAGSERFRFSAGHGRVHAADALTVREHFGGIRAVIRDEMPKGTRVRVFFEVVEWNDLDIRKHVVITQAEGHADRIPPAFGPARVGNLHNPRMEPMGEENDVNAGQNDHGRNE